MFNGYKMPSRRRYAKSRRRRPKARRRVDKVQDRRISRLEKATEKKFVSNDAVQTLVSSQITSTQQIYSVIPSLSTADEYLKVPLVGNQLTCRQCRVDFQLTNTLVSGADVRVLFFWNICPRTWSTTTSPPSSTLTTPSWNQLLQGFDGTVSATNGRIMMAAPHQNVSDSNKSPIVRLSDRIIHLGGKDSSNSSKKLSFVKSYKSMILAYNQHFGGGGDAAPTFPVNRNLFMAVLPCHTNEVEGDDAGSVYLAYSCQMHYTDS